MQIVQEHDVKDIYRVGFGLLVEITKYKKIGYHVSGKRPEKRVRGCKGLTELKEDYLHYPKGTLFYYGWPVEPTTNVDEFQIEVKSSGGSFGGSIKETQESLHAIQDILNSYK